LLPKFELVFVIIFLRPQLFYQATWPALAFELEVIDELIMFDVSDLPGFAQATSPMFHAPRRLQVPVALTFAVTSQLL